MKPFKGLKNLLPLVPAAAILASMMLSHSCANTTSAPTGGPKDTIPPVLTKVYPMPGQLNVPTHNTNIIFTFNEFVVVKDAKAIYLSPPLEKPLKARTKGKSVVVSFEDDLLPNTTYNIDITGAIVDNNEGNKFPGFSLTFSTGERIDSMYVTGLVQDCKTLNPVKGATVMLYKDQADSAVFLSRPDAAVKTDDWGYFVLRNIPDTVYRMYAVLDENSNNKFDPETEKIAFCDSLVIPDKKVGPGIYELFKFDMLDTASVLKRKTDYELNLFKGENSKQMLVNKERVGERTTYVTFMAPYAQVNSFKFKGISDKKVISWFNETRDSLVMWINNPKPQPDTLFMDIDYMKTDSTGALVKTVEKIKFTKPKELKKGAAGKSSRKDKKHEDTIAVFKVEAQPERFEQYGISIAFDFPLVEEAFDSLKYEIVNPRQKTEPGKYTWSRDTADFRIVHVRHSGRILPGYEYILTVPHRKFRDINGFLNDSLVTKVKLPDDDKLSKLTLNVSGVDSTRYLVDLMNEKRNSVLRNYVIEEDAVLEFPYLKTGKYCIRITEDKNRNNRVDTGDLLGHLQPEKVRFYKLADGTFLINIMEAAELSQDINLKELFK